MLHAMFDFYDYKRNTVQYQEPYICSILSDILDTSMYASIPSKDIKSFVGIFSLQPAVYLPYMYNYQYCTTLRNQMP